MAPDCKKNLHLWSSVEYIPLAIFVISIMVGYLNVEVNWLVCSMIKSLNATSKTIHWINQEMSQATEVVLDDWAVINYLCYAITMSVRNLNKCAILIFLLKSVNSQLVENNSQKLGKLSSR